MGVAIATGLIPLWLNLVQPLVPDPATLTVLFHLSFNLLVAALFIGFTRPVAALVEKVLPLQDAGGDALSRPNHLDPSALWPRLRWPFPARRVRRCTRPIWWRPCCAA